MSDLRLRRDITVAYSRLFIDFVLSFKKINKHFFKCGMKSTHVLAKYCDPSRIGKFPHHIFIRDQSPSNIGSNYLSLKIYQFLTAKRIEMF